jgi:biotin transport system substrate-specific component
MEIAAVVHKVGYDYFRWRFSLSIPWKLVLVLGMTVLTALLAQIRLPLPFSPVPVTGQTFAVLLAGVLLGRWWGGASMTLYVGLGVLGVPWFTGWSSGLGATGGYLFGFILAALFLGYIIDKNINSLRMTKLLMLMLFANFILIYVPGIIWLGAWYHLVLGQPVELWLLLSMGLFPFIIGDIIKSAAAAVVARGAVHKPTHRGNNTKL